MTRVRFFRGFHRLWLPAALLGLPAVAQVPLNPPAPLLAAVQEGSTAGEEAANLIAARRTHDLGLPGVAADLYRRVLVGGAGDRGAVTLALVSALLDAGRLDEAEKVLGEQPEPRPAAWRLRGGLLAIQRRAFDRARAELAAIREADLPAEDLPWLFFLQAELLVGRGGISLARGISTPRPRRGRAPTSRARDSR